MSRAAIGRTPNWKEFAASRPLAVIAGVVLLSPILALPQLIPFGYRNQIVIAATLAAFSSAVACVRHCRATSALTVALATAVAIAWFGDSTSPDALSHVSGVALGILWMGALVALCQSQKTLAVAASLFMIAAIAILTVGLLNTSIPVAKLAPYLYSGSARLIHLRDGATVSVAELIPQLVKGRLSLLDSLFQMFSPPRNGVNANSLAGTALMISPLAFALSMPGLPRTSYYAVLRVVAMGLAALVMLTIVMTQSRGAWLVGAATVLAFVVRSSFSLRARWAVAGAAIFLPLVALVITFATGRVTPAQAWAASKDSLSVRAVVWSQGAELLRKSPLQGIGFNEFRRKYHAPAGAEGVDIAHAHNIWLQTALDVGVWGLAAYAGLIVMILRAADSAARASSPMVARVGAGAGLSLVAVILFGIFDAIPLGARVGWFQWFASGLALAAFRMSGRS